MKLTDLLENINGDVNLWISTSTEDTDCIYFNEARCISPGLWKSFEKYTVKEIYVERYPALYCHCHGITIIVCEE